MGLLLGCAAYSEIIVLMFGDVNQSFSLCREKEQESERAVSTDLT